jgi:hypothetical protein
MSVEFLIGCLVVLTILIAFGAGWVPSRSETDVNPMEDDWDEDA